MAAMATATTAALRAETRTTTPTVTPVEPVTRVETATVAGIAPAAATVTVTRITAAVIAAAATVIVATAAARGAVKIGALRPAVAAEHRKSATARRTVAGITAETHNITFSLSFVFGRSFSAPTYILLYVLPLFVVTIKPRGFLPRGFIILYFFKLLAEISL